MVHQSKFARRSIVLGLIVFTTQQVIANTDGLIIVDSERRFSDLDGGPDDRDQTSDGIFTVKNLSIGEGGRILLDVPRAEFNVENALSLGSDGSIATPPDDLPVVGPIVTIRAGGFVHMDGTSSISVNGGRFGGAVLICSAGGIKLWDGAHVSADAIPSGSPTHGGVVWLVSDVAVWLAGAKVHLTANGSNGGTIVLTTCGSSAPSVLLRGTVEALGLELAGGTVDVEARQGGVAFDVDSGFIRATGVTEDGAIRIRAGTTVTPMPPPAEPNPVLVLGQPSDEPCVCVIDLANDCNHNGIQDQIELEECDGDAACDDCNGNGVLDPCDIASGESLDLEPADGIPDECREFLEGGCVPPSPNWSCAGNWTLPGDLFPDDLESAPDVSVTLGSGDNAFLDVSVQIPLLRLLDGATLRISQTGGVGDLGFSDPAVLMNQGSILVAHDRTVGEPSGVPPTLTFGPNGSYGKDPSSFDPSNARLAGASLRLAAGSCADATNGAIVELVDQMSLSLQGDLVLEGADVTACGARRESRLRGGITPPPKFKVGGGTIVDVGGTAVNTASLPAGPVPPPSGTLKLGAIVEVAVFEDATVRMRGDFQNQSTVPELFDWLDGKQVMNGTTPQLFEVAGVDVGATVDGFLVNGNTNFSIGELRIASGSDVTFINQFANTVGAGACTEALYVRHLILEAGANITLDNCVVYVRSLTNGGVEPVGVGCGKLVVLPPPPKVQIGDDTCHQSNTNLGVGCAVGSDCAPTAVCGLKSRYISIVPSAGLLGGQPEPFAIHVSVAPSTAGTIAEDGWWVGPEQDIPNTSGPALRGAPLVCASNPYSQVWTTEVLHVFGTAVVPGTDYEVRICEQSGTVCSDPFMIETGVWGDVVAPYQGTGQPNFADIASIVDGFRGLVGAPDTPRMDLLGKPEGSNANVPDQVISMRDVALAVDAFSGLPYPYSVPSCPS